MFELKITMEITGLPEALNNLANAITASTASAAVSAAPAPVAAEPVAAEPVATPANVVVPYPAATPAANPTMAAPAQPAPITPTVAPTPAPAPVQANATATAAPAVSTAPAERSYTLEELSRAGAGLVDRGMMPQLCELLRKYGVQAVTMLDPSQYGALAADLKALGANL